MKRMGAALVMMLAACGGGGGGGGGGDGGSGGPEPENNQSALLFNEEEFNDVHLTMSAADWDSIVDDSRGDEQRRCTFRWKDLTVESVGARPSGEFSRRPGNRKQSVRIDFNTFVPRQKFLGLKSLKLDGLSIDPSFLRDRLSYGVFRSRMPGPRAVHCRLFVNGEYRGVYQIEERIDSVFAQSRFGGQTGDVYRVMSYAQDQYLWMGSDPEWYVPLPFDPKTHELTVDPSFLVRFLDVLNHDVGSVEGVCDVEMLLEYLACEAAVIDDDGMTGDYGGGNHYQYYRYEDGRFHVLPWDMNSTWWTSPPDRSIFQNFRDHAITSFVENDPRWRARYKQKIGEVVAGAADPARIAARVDFIYFQIRDAVYADPFKPYTSEDFDNSRDFIRQVAIDRAADLNSQIAVP